MNTLDILWEISMKLVFKKSNILINDIARLMNVKILLKIKNWDKWTSWKYQNQIQMVGIAVMVLYFNHNADLNISSEHIIWNPWKLINTIAKRTKQKKYVRS